MRSDGRSNNQPRKVEIVTEFVKYPEGSVLYRAGGTVVLCNVSLLDRVPQFLKGTGEGWVTAEYSMLPRSTEERTDRGMGGRIHEIQRLIGRSLRQAVDRSLLGERTLIADCDVIQADGSTRTASISGAWVALALALLRMWEDGLLDGWPLTRQIAAVSVGMVRGEAVVDLDYAEDLDCSVDLNLVFSGSGKLVEVQGTAELEPFSRSQLIEMLELGWQGAQTVLRAQREALKPYFQGLAADLLPPVEI